MEGTRWVKVQFADMETPYYAAVLRSRVRVVRVERVLSCPLSRSFSFLTSGQGFPFSPFLSCFIVFLFGPSALFISTPFSLDLLAIITSPSFL